MIQVCYTPHLKGCEIPSQHIASVIDEIPILSLVAAHFYKDGQTLGRGFIGLAAMIFGNWMPGGLAMGAGLFGFTDSLQLRDPESVHVLILIVAIAMALLALCFALTCASIARQCGARAARRRGGRLHLRPRRRPGGSGSRPSPANGAGGTSAGPARSAACPRWSPPGCGKFRGSAWCGR